MELRPALFMAISSITLLFFAVRLSASAERTWTSADGLFEMEAELVEVKDHAVVLKRMDGKQLTVPLEKLSNADRKFVKRWMNRLPTESSIATRVADGEQTADSPQLEDDVAAITLPEKYHQICSGGAGRYLIFHFRESKKLGIFDVAQAKLVHEIKLPGEDVVFAAGLDKLMVLLPAQKLLHRYSLDGFEREQSTPFGDGRPVNKAVMGCNSQGPLCLWSSGPVVLVDIAQMKPLAVQGPLLRGDTRYGFGLRVSADGHTFAGWTEGISGQQYSIMRFFGDSVATVQSPDGHTFNRHWAQPNTDGSLIFRYGGGIYNSDMKVIASKDFEGAVLMPTEDVRYFLAALPQEKGKSRVSICTTADRRVVFTVDDIDSVTSFPLYTEWGYIDGCPRVQYLPSAKLLVVLPDGNDRVVIRRLDLFQELADRGEDYLFVTSVPVPQTATRGSYKYQIEVASSAGRVNFKLESGPKGMKVSDTGLVSWNSATQPASVIVSIRDRNSNEIFHSFDIQLTASPVPSTATPSSASTTPNRSTLEPSTQ